jgi:hypothetical protein
MRLMAGLLMTVGIIVTGCASQNDKCAMPVARADCPAGTAGYEEQQQQKQDAQTLATIDDARCRSFGDQPASPAYARCRANLTAERAQQIKIPER